MDQKIDQLIVTHTDQEEYTTDLEILWIFWDISIFMDIFEIRNYASDMLTLCYDRPIFSTLCYASIITRMNKQINQVIILVRESARPFFF